MPAQLVSGSNGLLQECYSFAEKIQQKIETVRVGGILTLPRNGRLRAIIEGVTESPPFAEGADYSSQKSLLSKFFGMDGMDGMEGWQRRPGEDKLAA